MSVYKAWASALESKNHEAAMECIADDYAFVRHQTGTSMDRAAMGEMLKGMMASEDVKFENRRCVYENDEVMVEHVFVDFPDGTREAVLSVNLIKDGKMIRSETGATLLKKD